MEDWSQIIKSIAVTAENVTTVGRKIFEMAIEKKSTEKERNAEIQAYRRRVRNRNRTGEYRPEWDLIGRVAFDENGKQFLTEMDQISESLRNTMTGVLTSGAIKPGPNNTVEVSDDDYRYLLEVATNAPSGKSFVFVFWCRPVD